jgi:hypothetical protein
VAPKSEIEKHLISSIESGLGKFKMAEDKKRVVQIVLECLKNRKIDIYSLGSPVAR